MPSSLREQRSTGSPATCSCSPATRRSSPKPSCASWSKNTVGPEPTSRFSRSSRTIPGAYGRVLRDTDGALRGIVEAVDASPEELETREVNSSIYVFRAEALWPALDALEPHNAQGELYLTDAVRHIVEHGGNGAVHRAPDPREALGVNTRAELAAAAAVLRARINERHMLAGVTIVDPDTTWIEAEVELAEDVVVHPFTVLAGRTRVERGARIGPHAAVSRRVDR